MGRILFFIVLGLVVYVFFKSWQRKQLGDSPSKGGALPRVPQEQTIYQCRQCGSYAPLNEGVMIEGRFYCQAEHARQAGESLRV